MSMSLSAILLIAVHDMADRQLADGVGTSVPHAYLVRRGEEEALAGRRQGHVVDVGLEESAAGLGHLHGAVRGQDKGASVLPR